jgi:capsular exopolysaccharide synthesis family protein
MAGGTHSNGYHSNNSLFDHNGEDGGSSAADGRNEDELELRHLFYLLWGHKWTIAGITAACVLLAGLAATLKTPIYQSSGSIMMTESQNQLTAAAGSDLGSLLSNSYGIGTGSTIVDELQILRSRKLSNVIADTLMQMGTMRNGRQYPVLFETYPDDSSMALKDTVAYRLREHLRFSQAEEESNLVNITFESPSPLEAASVIDLSIELYSSLSTLQNRKSANAAVDFLQNERRRIENRLNKVEVRLQQYMDKNELVQIDAQTESMIQRLAQLEQSRQETRTRLVAVNSALDQYQEQLDGIKPGLADQYADAIGPSMQRLQYQLAELKTERMQMITKNPALKNDENPPERLQTINRRIKEYQDEIRSQTQKLLSESDQYLGFLGSSGEGGGIAENVTKINQKLIELKVQQQQYQSQKKVLDEEIAQLNAVFDDLPANMTGLARLKRSVTINEELYLTVSKQYAEMSLWQQTQFGQGQLVDDGYIPDEPIEPNTLLYLMVGFVLGGILGVGYVFVKEGFNTTIDGTQKLKQFKAPLLAVIPDLQPYIDKEHEGEETVTVQDDHEVSTSLVSLLNTISPAAEAFRRLESNILHSNPDTDFKSLLVTSTTKGEGKTTIAANLAVIMAEADKNVIVVDTDLRRPKLHEMFGLSRTPGVMEVLFEDVSLEEAIQPTVVENLKVLCAGKRPPNPSAITKSDSFLGLIGQLKQQYDCVILDTAPFGIITDSASFMKQAEGVVVVSRFGKTDIGELEHTLEQLHRIDAGITGTLLNGFDADKSSDQYYGSNHYKELYRDYETYSS